MTNNGIAAALEAFLSILDRLELRYAVGGSVASSIHGIGRTTFDVDVVVNVTLDDVEELVRLAKSEFYIDENDVRSSIRSGRSFNVIHLPSACKVDIFPALG